MKFLTHGMLRSGVLSATIALTLILLGCNPTNEQTNPPHIGSTWILCEGPFGASQASITAYDPLTQVSVNHIFSSANGQASLGDSPSSAQIYNNQLYVTLSGSGKIYIIDPKSAQLKGKITGLDSPRFIEFISPNKAYVTNVGSPQITIIDPSTGNITGSIATPTAGEMMVKIDRYVYCNLWSYGTKIIKIDTTTDQIVAQNHIGIQPLALIKDADGMLWSMCDGGYEGGPLGKDNPSLLRIDPKDLSVINKWVLPSVANAFSLRLTIDPKGENIYFMNGNIYKMGIHHVELPSESLINTPSGVSFYNIGVNPSNGDIYASDAVDFKQNGWIYRFDKNGQQINRFEAAIVPAVFCFLVGF